MIKANISIKLIKLTVDAFRNVIQKAMQEQSTFALGFDTMWKYIYVKKKR